MINIRNPCLNIVRVLNSNYIWTILLDQKQRIPQILRQKIKYYGYDKLNDISYKCPNCKTDWMDIIRNDITTRSICNNMFHAGLRERFNKAEFDYYCDRDATNMNTFIHDPAFIGNSNDFIYTLRNRYQ